MNRARKRIRRNSGGLPGDIITEILLRVPFDSILNCKLVSTEWKNLINHPTFSINYKGYTNSMSLFTDYFDRIFCLRIRHDMNKQLTKAGNPHFTINQIPIECEEDTNFIYTHISNGVACMKNKIGVYNLITGSPALHPLADSPLCPQYNYWWKYFGFGYDAYADDYKIVQFCHFFPTVDHKTREIVDAALYDAYADTTQFWVYSFKNQVWKSFNVFPYSEYAVNCDWIQHSGATTVNGVLHWVVPHKGVIITYDLHTGVFGEIVLPGVGNADFGLQEVNGNLWCTYKIRYKYHVQPVFDVWRMVGDSWEMLVSIDCKLADGNIPWNRQRFREIPLMLHEFVDGRRLVLFLDESDPTLHWYDFVNNKCETIRKKVWRQQRIKYRCAGGKRKTSLVVKN